MEATTRRAAVQADVLRATEELLADGTAWADLSIERIATTAGISRTAFYFYFRDKRELLMRLVEAVSELLYIEADRWYSGNGDDGEIHEALTQIAALYERHHGLLRTIVEVATYDEEVATFWRSLMGRFAEVTCMRIEAEQEAGKAPGFPAAPTAFALMWMCERTLYQLSSGNHSFSRDEAVEALVRIFRRTVYG